MKTRKKATNKIAKPVVIDASKYKITQAIINDDALYVIEKLKKHGFDAYIVGGGIRDLLLGQTPKDFDIVTNAKPDEICKIFKRHSMVIGRRFKIVHIVFSNINPEKMVNNRPIIAKHIIEVSTYRSTKVHKKALNPRGKIIEDNNYGTIDEDALRRDFTINALYYDPIKNVILDYHNGIIDIKNRILNLIGNPKLRFNEDPVRMLRAIRLSIKLGVSISPEIQAQFDTTKHLLLHEHEGRMYEEMLKILLCGSAIACISYLHKLKIPKGVFPLFDKLFFKTKPDLLARKMVEKTDLRLKTTADVSIIFILSGLLWNMVDAKTKKIMTSKQHKQHVALLEAIEYFKNTAWRTGISKQTYSGISHIWMLQLEFETHDKNTQVGLLMTKARFRQAWYLFSARHELQQVNGTTFNWWSKQIAKHHK